MSCWIYSASYSLHLGTFKAAVKIFWSEQGHESQAPHPHYKKANETVLSPWEGQLVSGPAHLSTSGPLYPLHLVYISRSQVIIDTDTEQGLVGFLSTKLFCVPHFFDYRKYPSFSFHDLS